MWNFLAHLLIYMKILPEDAHLLKRLRKSWNVDFRCQVPRTSVQVRYHFKWFFKLHNLRNSDSNSMCSKILKIPEFTLNINRQYFHIFLVLVIISATVTSMKNKIAPGKAKIIKPFFLVMQTQKWWFSFVEVTSFESKALTAIFSCLGERNLMNVNPSF